MTNQKIEGPPRAPLCTNHMVTKSIAFMKLQVFTIVLAIDELSAQILVL